MGIPILGEIWDGVRWIIDQFTDKLPKPLQFLFFLLFILFIGLLIPLFLHLLGLHCNHDGDPVRVSPLKFLDNVKIGFTDANEVYNESSYIPDPLTFDGIAVESCRKPICLHNGKYFYQSDSACDNETIIYPYLTVRLASARCSICEGTVNRTTILGVVQTDTDYLCFGDAYSIEEDDKNWYQSWTCDEDRCAPPYHFYYEYDTGTYDCLDLDVCGYNISANYTVRPVIDELLDAAGAERIYGEGSKEDYRRVASVQCDADLKPQLAFFSIPLFDYKIWLFLMVIYVMYLFLTNLPTH